MPRTPKISTNRRPPTKNEALQLWDRMHMNHPNASFCYQLWYEERGKRLIDASEVTRREREKYGSVIPLNVPHDEEQGVGVVESTNGHARERDDDNVVGLPDDVTHRDHLARLRRKLKVMHARAAGRIAKRRLVESTGE